MPRKNWLKVVRRETILEHISGKPPDVRKFSKLLDSGLTDKLLGYVWMAYDKLYTDLFTRIDWTKEYDDLERSITERLEHAIEDVIYETGGFLPFHVQHAPAERESRREAPAQPPTYDIAFISNEDPRIMWPLEAKVLKSDAGTERNLGDYIQTLKQRYLKCKYAPFANGGAMVGYLKQGDSLKVFEHLGEKLGCTLVDYPTFAARAHRISDHIREVPAGKDYPKDFRCHHLIMLCERTG